MKLSKCIKAIEHGRTNYIRFAKDTRESISLEHLGWDHLDGPWYRCPDVWLVDLADPFRIKKHHDPVTNLAYYNFIHDLFEQDYFESYAKDIIKHDDFYNNLEFEPSIGNVLETEYRLLGNDYRLDVLKNDLFDHFVKNGDFENYLNRAKTYLGETRGVEIANTSFDKLDVKMKSLFEEIHAVYLAHGEEIKFSSETIPNIINKLPEHDIMILVPKACFKYWLSLVDTSKTEKVNFYELHSASKSNKQFQYFRQPIDGKNVLIADGAYSGNTITAVSSIIKENNGFPIKLGMFPKNRKVIDKLDYFVFGDRLFKAGNVTSDKDWPLQQYKNTFSVEAENGKTI